MLRKAGVDDKLLGMMVQAGMQSVGNSMLVAPTAKFAACSNQVLAQQYTGDAQMVDIQSVRWPPVNVAVLA